VSRTSRSTGPDGEFADLVASFAEIPGLRDELDLGDDRVLVNDVEERPQAVHIVQLPGEGRRQVEAEAVHVHLQHPVAQAVHDELERPGMGHVERVPAAGVVHAVAPVVGDEPVVGRVVDPPETERGTQMAAFAGVVVDHVQDHLDTRLVQGLDHGLELADLLAEGAAAGVPDIRREEPDGVVPPVVGQPSFHQVPVRHELVDGEQPPP
jgi:hypothetical protein